MNNKISHNNLDRKINPELEKHFYIITNLIRSFPYDLTVSKFLVLSLIFVKRLVDIKYFNQNEIYAEYQNIRNLINSDLNRTRELIFKLIDLICSTNPLFQKTLLSTNLNLTKEVDQKSLYELFFTIDKHDYSLNHYSIFEFGNAFNYLIESTQDRKSLEYLTPTFIKHLMTELLDMDFPRSLYDPAVGIGGFFNEINNRIHSQNFQIEGSEFIGQERNQSTFTLFVMNMFMNGLYKIKPFLGDTLTDPQNVEDNLLIKYDGIISDPPLGMSSMGYEEIYRNDKFFRFQYGIPNKNSSFGFVQHILASLKSTGKAVVLLNKNILFSQGNDYEIRKSIIERDLIECIIQLPSGILDFTSVPPIIIVFKPSKSPGRKNRIQIINIAKRYTADELKNIGIKSVVKDYKNFSGRGSYSYNVEIGDIIRNNYNLSIERYSDIYQEIKSLLNTNQAKKLSDLFNVVRGVRVSDGSLLEEQESYLITTKDLSRDVLSKHLETEKLKVKRVKGRKISDKCIIMSLVGSELKPTIYDPESLDNHSTPITIGNNIAALIPKNNIIKLEYLYYQLYGTEVQEQISVMRKGVIPNFSISQLKELVIPVPSLENMEKSLNEQELFIKQQAKNLLELEELRFKEKVKELIIEKVAVESESTTIRTLSHNILPIVTQSSMALTNLKSYLINKNLMADQITELTKIAVDPQIKDYITSINNSQTVGDVFYRVENYLEHMQNVITKTRDIITETIKEEDFELCNLQELILNFVNEKRNEYQNYFEIIFKCLPNIYVQISKTHFIEVLNNLIRNAKSHAFNYQDKHIKRVIEFSVDEKQELDQIIITYKNNGNKVEVTENEFFQALKEK